MDRVYLDINFHADYRHYDRIEGISRTLEAKGYRCVCAVLDLERWARPASRPTR